MGCTDPLRRGVGARHQCPLGSAVSCLIYVDMQLHVPMTLVMAGTWSRMNGLLSMESCVTDQIAELRKLGVVGLSRQDAADIVKLRVDKLRTANPAGT